MERAASRRLRRDQGAVLPESSAAHAAVLLHSHSECVSTTEPSKALLVQVPNTTEVPRMPATLRFFHRAVPCRHVQSRFVCSGRSSCLSRMFYRRSQTGIFEAWIAGSRKLMLSLGLAAVRLQPTWTHCRSKEQTYLAALRMVAQRQHVFRSWNMDRCEETRLLAA